ncbi:cytochrome P450 [Mycena rosella]|uniref:Cytochrome P450 n=1 Tax=Mycena rosella TaxID=1033263 RepID=A0AAD7GGS5_MYCRO|nr:cytochrome P450 [Mycena rosella]
MNLITGRSEYLVIPGVGFLDPSPSYHSLVMTGPVDKPPLAEDFLGGIFPRNSSGATFIGLIAMNSNRLPLIYALLCASAIALLFYFRVRRHSLPLPPGPRKLPLVGNLFSMPRHTEWETFWKWSKEYDSDIIYLNAIGTSIVVLSSVEAAEDLLDKRSAIYSDRPAGHMLELIGGYFMFALQRYGDTWRTHRRHFHHELNAVAARRFRSLELQQAHHLLRRVLENPDAFAEHYDYIFGGIMMTMAYGLDTLPHDDPYISAAHGALRVLTGAAVPGRFLVDVIPALKYVPAWFPGASFKRKAAEWKKLIQEMVDLPFAASKDAMARGIERPSFIASRLTATDDGNDEAALELDIKQVSATMYATDARNGHGRATLLMFLRAMMENPNAQKMAQQEIDAVIRPGHLPGFEDEDQLPYLTAVVKETMRWWPVAPMGVPHAVTEDDIYRGYRIPAGSVIIANSWAMLHDESTYPDPHAFKPERFLLNGKLNPAVRDPLDIVFGFGRRSCPGRYLGLDSVWIMIASMLAVFDVSKAIGEDGKPIEPPPGQISELVVAPVPFKCSIKPRSRAAAELVLSTAVL